MPAILFTNSSPLAGAVGAPASRPKPNRNRTIYNMHSSRNGHKLYPQSTRSRTLQPSISTAAVSSTTATSPASASPTPSVLSPASSSISFFPPYPSQSPTQSRSNSQSSIQSISSVSSSTSTSSNRSSTSVSSTPYRTQSNSPTSMSVPTRSAKGAAVTDAYKKRYASYLASTFNMSMEAALIEADYQLLPQLAGKDGGISEAEVYRSD